MNKTLSRTYKSNQAGVVLFISLILLSVLTILALTGMKTSIVDEKMSGNLRDHELAHQAAESALRDAQTFIDNMASVTALTNTNGLLREGDDIAEKLEPDYLDDSTWDSATPANYSTASVLGANQLAEPPKYIIKHIGAQDLCNTSGVKDPYGFNTNLCWKEIFRVTAHGTGMTPGTTKILQAYYEKERF